MTDQITVSRELLRRALDALEGAVTYDWRGTPLEESDCKCDMVAVALRAALEQPAQKPVRTDTEAQPSPTAGMNIAQRILHVGGRNNAAGYVEFGSIQAVEALVRQVIRDLPKQPEPEPEAYIVEVRRVNEPATHWRFYSMMRNKTIAERTAEVVVDRTPTGVLEVDAPVIDARVVELVRRN